MLHRPFCRLSGILRGGLVVCLLVTAVGCAPQQGIYHTVQAGESLARIGRAYGVDELTLARINGIQSPADLRSGDRVFIPAARKPRTLTPVAAAPREAKPAPPAVARQQPARGKSAATPSAPNLPPVDKERFTWPLKGETLRRFGEQSPPCKGVEIAATAGAPVLSAAAGKVIYSGDGISSFGNLVILKHDQDYYTVYAYNQRNLVKAGSFVSRGEQIAAVGSPPGGGRTRLYFELRHGKEPLDPTIYLP